MVSGHSQLTLHTRRDRLSRIGEGDEQRVSFGPHLDTSMTGHRGTEQLVMVCQQAEVTLAQLRNSLVDPSMSVRTNVTRPDGSVFA